MMLDHNGVRCNKSICGIKIVGILDLIRLLNNALRTDSSNAKYLESTFCSRHASGTANCAVGVHVSGCGCCAGRIAAQFETAL